jgi:acyl-CoA synthetase (AMP-forming)/AMP-acid ligase II
MTDASSSILANRSSIQTELFRPSLQYPSHPYAEILSHIAERFPENEAVIFRDVNLTYRELDALVNAFATALLKMGIRKGDRVCLLMTNRPEFLVSWFALARIGAIISPMNPSYKEREVAYQLSNSEAVAIVVQQELLPLVEAVHAQTPALEHVIVVGAGQEALPPQVHSFRHMVRDNAPTQPAYPAPALEDLLTLPYSSGTTGFPKGVMLSHQNVVCNACQSVARGQRR